MKHRLWAAALLAAGFVGTGTLPAAAVDPLLFSPDGQTWATELEQPIFGAKPVLVPGDVASASFWVRNASGDPADLKIALVADWPDSGADPDTLWVRAGVDGAPAASGGDIEPVLLKLDSIDALDSRKVTVTVGLDAAAGNSSQKSNQLMSFDVRLTQSIPDPVPETAPAPGTGSQKPAQPKEPVVAGRSEERAETRPGGPSGTLSDTGFTAVWAAVAGTALTAGGILAVAYSRKKKSTSEEGGHGPA